MRGELPTAPPTSRGLRRRRCIPPLLPRADHQSLTTPSSLRGGRRLRSRSSPQPRWPPQHPPPARRRASTRLATHQARLAPSRVLRMHRPKRPSAQRPLRPGCHPNRSLNSTCHHRRRDRPRDTRTRGTGGRAARAGGAPCRARAPRAPRWGNLVRNDHEHRAHGESPCDGSGKAGFAR